MKNKNIHKIIISLCTVTLLILSISKMLTAISDRYESVNYCYMLMYGRIEEERGDIECWKE
ncbi:hypothetical protein ACWOA6_05820 [Globicatella sulfidifaciens]|uniref:Uncharacterized protein n=1 Tax=Globicatella sulfidifaciens DSM 15739 TaxID=1121925 RepID=A0A1T4L9V9_9LACT|nr:hypothetical protein [Globicatella sulfidifaciens]SJZ51361.1 hypothetical protein SAMN02746011_01008 [Globicatella sulfidifaciens DSM 15739]